MAAEVPAPPLTMTAIIETSGGAADLAGVVPSGGRGVPALPAEEAPVWRLERDAVVLDVHERSE